VRASATAPFATFDPIVKEEYIHEKTKGLRWKRAKTPFAGPATVRRKESKTEYRVATKTRAKRAEEKPKIELVLKINKGLKVGGGRGLETPTIGKKIKWPGEPRSSRGEDEWERHKIPERGVGSGDLTSVDPPETNQNDDNSKKTTRKRKSVTPQWGKGE